MTAHGAADRAEAAGACVPGTAPGAAPVLDRVRNPAGGGTQMAGLLLLLGSVFVFTMMDATAKHLTQTYNPGLVVWARFAGNFLIVMAIFGPRLRSTLRSVRPWVQLFRGLTQLVSVVMFFTAITFIGLAEATAIMDVNPVLITLFAALFLGERIGPRRIAGIAVALVGAMIIIRPGSGVLHPAAILPMIGAVSYAAGAILTRMSRADSTRTSVLWSALIGTTATTLILPFVWEPIALGDLWAFALLGVFGTIAQTMIIRAFAMAEASAIAPFGYTGLIWAGVWGWLFWGTIPDAWTLIGAALIVGAGLYIWTREAQSARASQRTAAA
ncbi:DMT family transporter [Paracoccus suum]|nr:DMT family transporter [Paracoccus suum]